METPVVRAGRRHPTGSRPKLRSSTDICTALSDRSQLFLPDSNPRFQGHPIPIRGDAPAGRTQSRLILYGISVVQATVFHQGLAGIAGVEVGTHRVAVLLHRQFTIHGGRPLVVILPKSVGQASGDHGAVRIQLRPEVLREPALFPDLHHLVRVTIHCGRHAVGINQVSTAAIIQHRFGVEFHIIRIRTSRFHIIAHPIGIDILRAISPTCAQDVQIQTASIVQIGLSSIIAGR